MIELLLVASVISTADISHCYKLPPSESAACVEKAVMDNSNAKLEAGTQSASAIRKLIADRQEEVAPPSAELVQSWVGLARDAVADRLRDPDSAKFRRETFRSLDGRDQFVVCGEINGTNAYGGYTGYQRFFHIAGHMTSIESSGSDVYERNRFEKEWNAACYGHTPVASGSELTRKP